MLGDIGTRERFRTWLSVKYRITYTQYSRLPTDRKLAIQAEYQGKSNKEEARKGEA